MKTEDEIKNCMTDGIPNEKIVGMTDQQAIEVLNMVEAHGPLTIRAKELAIVALKEHRPKGEWVDYSDDGFVECPFCGSATTCDDNKDELHFCWNCGAEMRGGAK